MHLSSANTSPSGAHFRANLRRSLSAAARKVSARTLDAQCNLLALASVATWLGKNGGVEKKRWRRSEKRSSSLPVMHIAEIIKINIKNVCYARARFAVREKKIREKKYISFLPWLSVIGNSWGWWKKILKLEEHQREKTSAQGKMNPGEKIGYCYKIRFL